MVMVKSQRQKDREEAIQQRAEIVKCLREQREQNDREEWEELRKIKEAMKQAKVKIVRNMNVENEKVMEEKQMEEIKVNDNVNHPKQYEGHTSIECIDNMRLIYGNQRVAEYCMLNAYKYLSRHEYKNGLEDLKKAEWYLNYAENMNLIYDDVCIDLEYIDKMDELRKRYEKKYEVNK